jgi:hypothetical protein
LNGWRVVIGHETSISVAIAEVNATIFLLGAGGGRVHLESPSSSGRSER